MAVKRRNKDHIMARYTLILALITLVAAAIAARLVSTTVIYADRWQQKAERSLHTETAIQPERGKILADDGSVLAANITYYIPRIDLRARGISRDTLEKYLPALSDSLAAMLPERDSAQWHDYIWDAYINRATRSHASSFRLTQYVTYSQLTRMKKFPFLNQKVYKSGFYTEEQTRRCNPYGTMAARSIGRVGQNAQKGRLAGISGLESALDDMLYGKPGVATKVQFTNGVRNFEKVPAINGYDIRTTINVNLQEIVDQELSDMCHITAAEWGTAVLMEVETGKIKAISNLRRNPAGQYVESQNYAVQGFEPGSVMKPISMMLALEDDLVKSVDEVIPTGGAYAYAGAAPIRDSHAYSSMPVHSVIAYSSNIGMAKIILRGYERQPGMFHHRLKEMGFFEPLNLGIKGERVPRVDSVGNKNWDKIQLSRMAYGYSTLIPPICTLTIYNAMANGGRYVRPRLVERFQREGEPDSIVPLTYIREQVCSPENAEKLRRMLREVVADPHGTGKSLKNCVVPLAGKTGTCYVNEPGRGYNTGKYRLSFCGFFPYDKPKYSCIVVMQGPKSGRGAAGASGTVMKNIATKLYSLGLLDNSSDYHSGNEHAVKAPIMLASLSGEKAMARLAKSMKAGKYRSAPKPQQQAAGVPNVVGLGAREAVATIEAAGYNVRISGTGRVVSQSAPPDSLVKPGDEIELTLQI